MGMSPACHGRPPRTSTLVTAVTGERPAAHLRSFGVPVQLHYDAARLVVGLMDEKAAPPPIPVCRRDRCGHWTPRSSDGRWSVGSQSGVADGCSGRLTTHQGDRRNQVLVGQATRACGEPDQHGRRQCHRRWQHRPIVNGNPQHPTDDVHRHAVGGIPQGRQPRWRPIAAHAGGSAAIRSRPRQS